MYSARRSEMLVDITRGWGPDLLVPHAVPHRPTSIFRLGLARRRGSQTL